MGSRLNAILRCGDEVTYSYCRVNADDLPGYLAFGPDAAWTALKAHQEKGAVIRVRRKRFDYMKAGFAEDILRLFEAGGEGCVLIDRDDQVLWYYSDYEIEMEGLWGTWFASWLEVFWQGWRIFRPQRNRCSDLLNMLGYPAADLVERAPVQFSRDGDIEFTKDRTSRMSLDGHPLPTSLVGLVRNGELALTALGEGTYAERLLAEGPSCLPGIEDRLPYSAEELIVVHNVEMVVDFDRKMVWTNLYEFVRGEAVNPDTELWPGWTIVGDFQGLAAWLGACGLQLSFGAGFKRYVRKAVRNIAEHCDAPNLATISAALDQFGIAFDRPLPKLRPASVPEGARQSGDDIVVSLDQAESNKYVNANRANGKLTEIFIRDALLKMSGHYFATCNPSAALSVDRRHPSYAFACRNPLNWEPDRDVYVFDRSAMRSS